MPAKPNPNVNEPAIGWSLYAPVLHRVQESERGTSIDGQEHARPPTSLVLGSPLLDFDRAWEAVPVDCSGFDAPTGVTANVTAPSEEQDDDEGLEPSPDEPEGSEALPEDPSDQAQEDAGTLMVAPDELELDDAWCQEPEVDDDPSPRRPSLIPPLVATTLRVTLLDKHLADIASTHAFLRDALACGDLTALAQDSQERRQLAAVDAIAWLGPEVARALAARIAQEAARDTNEAFALALALLSLEGVEGCLVVLNALMTAEPETAAGYAHAIRYAPNPELAPRLRGLFDAAVGVPATIDPVITALLVPALVDHAVFDASVAKRLIAQDDPGLLVATARAAVIQGSRVLVPALEGAAAGRDPVVAAELWAAAAILGSHAAMAAVRSCLADFPPTCACLLAALAVCGDDKDAPYIAAHARAEAPGAAQALQWLRQKTRGAPVAVATLAEPSATARCRELAFRDLVARTDHPVPYDVTWRAWRRHRAAGQWAETLQGAGESTPALAARRPPPRVRSTQPKFGGSRL